MHFFQQPKSGAVYNLGGSRQSNCSVVEAIALAEAISGKKLQYKIVEKARKADHIWWVSDTRKFRRDFADWYPAYDIKLILEELIDAAEDRGLKK